MSGSRILCSGLIKMTIMHKIGGEFISSIFGPPTIRSREHACRCGYMGVFLLTTTSYFIRMHT